MQAVALAAYAEARGPDALGVKAAQARACLSRDGVTTLGCSGTLLPSPTAAVLVPASLVLPFLTQARRSSPEGPVAPADILPGAAWSFSVEGGGERPAARPASPLAIVAAPGVALALTPLAAAGWVPAASGSASAGLLAILVGHGPLPAGTAAAVASAWAGAASAAAALPLGAPVSAAGAPLGPLSPTHFAGCALSGIVSATLGEALALLDARCLAGTEGGPVVLAGGRLAGVLGPPLVSSSSSSSGEEGLVTMLRLTPGLADAVGAAVRRSGPPPRPPPPPPSAAGTSTSGWAVPAPTAASLAPAIAALAPATTAVLVPGQSWASAVHVGRGVFLTAAHALPPPEEEEGAPRGGGRAVYVLAPVPRAARRRASPPAPAGHAWLPARRVGIDAPGLDVAALAVSPAAAAAAGAAPWPPPPAPRPPPSPPPPGTPVAALGWPRLHPRVGAGLLASAGVVSRSLSPGGRHPPELLVSSAPVSAGGSGGPLAFLDAGGAPAIAGLAVANVRALGAGGGTIPHLSLSLAGDALAGVWAAALGGGGGRRPARPPPPGRAALWALAQAEPSVEGKARPEGREALDGLLKRAGLPGVGVVEGGRGEGRGARL